MDGLALQITPVYNCASFTHADLVQYFQETKVFYYYYKDTRINGDMFSANASNVY